MTVDISHIVILGCSLAYCQGLESPKTQGWPALVANNFGVPVVNLAGKGAGNDKIMRRLFEYHYLNLKHDNNPFYIICFSHSSRREEYMRHRNDLCVVNMHPDDVNSPYDDFSKPCLINYEQEIVSRKKMMIQTYILNFLKQNKLNYLITDFLPDNEHIIDLYERQLSPDAHHEFYNDPYRIMNFSVIAKKHKPLPCGHDDLEAQAEIAAYTIPKLVELYGEVNHVNKPFATLADYSDHYKISGILKEIESEWF